MFKNSLLAPSLVAALLTSSAPGLSAQTAGQPAAGAQSSAAPRQSGTVKAVTPHDFVLTSGSGQDFAVTVTDKAHVLLVAPGSRDLNSAQPGSMSDVAAGDRVIVSGTAGDSGPMLTATRVIVMKSTAIAATHAEEQAAWQHGAGGIVKAVDPAGVITVSSGMRTLMVSTTPNTIVRRYAGGSVNFEDAVKSTIAVVQPGDQIRARGQRSADGASLTADEIVSGSFSNFSGVLSSADVSAGTVTLKDLATKKTVTVVITPQTNLRHLPAGVGGGTRGSGATAEAPAAGSGESTGNGGATQRAATGSQGAAGRPSGTGRTGMDLSRMLPRLPTQTVGELKQGDAVMIVASNNGEGRPTAITLLSGVEQILAASPSGQTTLSPWSLNASGGEAAGMEGGGASGPQ